MAVRFVYAGPREDEDLSLERRVMQGMRGILEKSLHDAGYDDLRVSRGTLSPGLVVRSRGAPLTAEGDRDVRDLIGSTMGRHVMSVARQQNVARFTDSGQFVSGGTLEGAVLGL